MIQKHKIVVLLISLFAAILFWLYVVTAIAPNTTGSVSGISVSVTGDTTLEARGLMITAIGTDTVRVDLEGSRATLSKLNSSNVTAYIDVQYITEAGDYDLGYSIAYPDTVSSGEIRLLGKSVDKISVTVGKVTTKSLDVNLQWSGQVPDGYLFDVGEVIFDPATVLLQGPDYEVDAVQSVVAYYDITELEETATVQAQLVFLDEVGNEVTLSDLTTVSARDVTMTLPILRFKDITLAVDLNYGSGITHENVTVLLDPETIRVSGPSEVINALSDTMTVGSIDLTKAENDDVFEFALQLPKGVNNVSGDTTVTATVKFTGLLYRSYTVTDIQLLNEPENYDVSLSTRAVTVRLRGSKELLDAIDAEHIHVRADLDEITQSGTYTIKATVEIDDAPDVGVVGDVELIISLS